MEFCCQEMKENVESDDIMARYPNKYFIRGRTRIFDDGDGYFDEDTDEIEIRYCPFCGKLIIV